MLKKPRIAHESPEAYFQWGPNWLNSRYWGNKRLGNAKFRFSSYTLCKEKQSVKSKRIVTKYISLHKLHLRIQKSFY